MKDSGTRTQAERGEKKVLRVLDEKGFNLVELMMVAGILSILTSLVVPTYQKFQARSRQMEAKLALSSAFTVETTIRSSQLSYTTCLSDAGFAREGIRHYYTIGFSDTDAVCGSGDEECHMRDFIHTQFCTSGAFPAGGIFPANASATGNPVTRAEFSASTPTQISRTQFQIGAAGVVYWGNPRQLDVWTINENKVIANVRPGF